MTRQIQDWNLQNLKEKKIFLHRCLFERDLCVWSRNHNQFRSNIDGMIILLAKHPKHYPEINVMSCPNSHQKFSNVWHPSAAQGSYRHFYQISHQAKWFWVGLLKRYISKCQNTWKCVYLRLYCYLG